MTAAYKVHWVALPAIMISVGLLHITNDYRLATEMHVYDGNKQK